MVLPDAKCNDPPLPSTYDPADIGSSLLRPTNDATLTNVTDPSVRKSEDTDGTPNNSKKIPHHCPMKTPAPAIPDLPVPLYREPTPTITDPAAPDDATPVPRKMLPSSTCAELPTFNVTDVAPLSRRVQGGGVAEQDATTRAVLGAARSETTMCR